MKSITTYAIVGCVSFFILGLILISAIESQNVINGILCFTLAALGIDAGAVFGMIRIHRNKNNG